MRPAVLICLLSVIPLSFARGQESAALDVEGEMIAEAEQLVRAIVCAEAIKLDSPMRAQAMGLLRSHRYTDPRFDQTVREAMVLREGEPRQAAHDRIEAAMSLIPATKLEASEKVKLALNLILVESDRFAGFASDSLVDTGRFRSERVPFGALLSVLGSHKAELAEQLKPLMAEQLTPLLCALAARSEESGGPLLPFLMEATQSDQQAIRTTGLDSLNRIVIDLKKARARAGRDTTADGRESTKYDKVVSRIIERYDKNSDNVLTEPEWSVMLMSPAEADANRDGKITVVEYAGWMEKRQRK